MAFDRPDLVGQPMGSDTLLAEKVVDITMHCRVKERKALLRFAQSEQGMVVQLVYYWRGSDLGLQCNFLMNSADFQKGMNESFLQYARNLGFTPEKLRQMILEHSPKVPVVA